MTTYISKVAKNGKMQYFRVDAEGKKKMIKRAEYEANMPDDSQAMLEEMDNASPVEETTTDTFAVIEIASDATDSVEPEYSPEPVPERPATAPAPAVENPFSFVKAAVESATGRYKLSYKVWKKYGSVYYRSCAVCGFALDDNGKVLAARFMGTTLESRKEVSVIWINSPEDWNLVTESVIAQIQFVNEWWGLSTKNKSVA